MWENLNINHEIILSLSIISCAEQELEIFPGNIGNFTGYCREVPRVGLEVVAHHIMHHFVAITWSSEF